LTIAQPATNKGTQYKNSKHRNNNV